MTDKSIKLGEMIEEISKFSVVYDFVFQFHAKSFDVFIDKGNKELFSGSFSSPEKCLKETLKQVYTLNKTKTKDRII